MGFRTFELDGKFFSYYFICLLPGDDENAEDLCIDGAIAVLPSPSLGYSPAGKSKRK